MKKDGSTEFVMVRKKFPAHLRESYAVICSNELSESALQQSQPRSLRGHSACALSCLLSFFTLPRDLFTAQRGLNLILRRPMG